MLLTDRYNKPIYDLLQNGDVDLDNVTHEDAVAALKATGERVVLVLVPGPRHGQPSPRTSRANTRKYITILVPLVVHQGHQNCLNCLNQAFLRFRLLLVRFELEQLS